MTSDDATPLPVWFSPQVIVAALLFLAALTFAVQSPVRPGAPPTVELDLDRTDTTVAEEIELAVVEPGGLERVVFVEVAVPSDEGGRYEAIFAALREQLIAAEVWPKVVPEPRIFVQQLGGRTVLVVDFDVPPGVATDVASELRVVDSIAATASRHGADVRYLVNGRSAETLLGHVAVPSGLAAN